MLYASPMDRWCMHDPFLGLRFPSPNVLLKNAGFVFSSDANRLYYAMVGALVSPTVDVRLVARLNVVTEEGLEKLVLFFLRRVCKPHPCLLDRHLDRMHRHRVL